MTAKSRTADFITDIGEACSPNWTVDATAVQRLPVQIDSICVHSDTPGVVAVAVRETLEADGVRLKPFAPAAVAPRPVIGHAR